MGAEDGFNLLIIREYLFAQFCLLILQNIKKKKPRLAYFV